MDDSPLYYWSLTVTLNWQFGQVPKDDTCTVFPPMDAGKQTAAAAGMPQSV